MPDQGAPKNRLVSIGSSPRREYSLDQSTIAIGSHPSNDVVIDDTTVSRRHATITRKPDGFELADLGSTNGTFVNGRQVRKPIAVKSGDEIKFGSARFAFNPAAVAAISGRLEVSTSCADAFSPDPSNSAKRLTIHAPTNFMA